MSNKSLMDILLSDDPASREDRPSMPFLWERHGIEIPCQGQFVDELRSIRKKATRKVRNPKTHELDEQFDFDMYCDLLVIACTPGAPWTDPEVREHYGVVEAVEAFRKAFRHPADYRAILEHCQALCGVGDLNELQPEEQVKN